MISLPVEKFIYILREIYFIWCAVTNPDTIEVTNLCDSMVYYVSHPVVAYWSPVFFLETTCCDVDDLCIV